MASVYNLEYITYQILLLGVVRDICSCSYVHPGTQLIFLLKIELKITCEMKGIGERHTLKNLCSALWMDD